MNEQREKFEAWANNAGFGLKYRESMFAAWEGAIASQAPRQALTDAEIMNIAGTIQPEDHQFRSGDMDFYSYDLALSRAIEAASGPNAALVEASRALLKYLDDHDWGGVPEGATSNAFRAALAAVGEGE